MSGVISNDPERASGKKTRAKKTWRTVRSGANHKWTVNAAWMYIVLVYSIFLPHEVGSIDLYFGSILPTSVIPALTMALYVGYEDFGKHLAGGVNLKYEPLAEYKMDDEGTPLVGLAETATLHSRGLAIIVGAGHSSVSGQIGILNAAAGVLQFSPFSTSPILTEKKNYPSFTRYSSNDHSEAIGISEMTIVLGFKKLHIISTDDDSATGITSIALEIFASNGLKVVTVDRVPFGIDRLEKRDLVRTKLKNIKDLGGRVIFLSAFINDARTVIEEAEKLNMIGNKEYMWIGTGAWTYQSITSGWPGHEQSLVGVIGTTTSYDWTKPEFVAFLKKYREVGQRILGTAPSEVNLDLALKAYDSVRVLVTALNNTIPRIQAMGIDVTCLHSTRFSTDPSCLISESERQAIYDRSIANKYNGVKEYMEMLRKATTGFGPKSRYVPLVFLEEIYKTKLRGIIGDFELDENGDGGNYFNLSNFRAIKQSNGSYEYRFELVGYKLPGLRNGVDFDTTSIVYPGGTDDNPNMNRPADSAQGTIATSEDSNELLYVYIGVGVGALFIGIIVLLQVRRVKRRVRQSNIDWLIEEDEVIVDSRNKISKIMFARSIDEECCSFNPSSINGMSSIDSQMSVANVKHRFSFFQSSAYTCGTWKEKKVVLKKAHAPSFNPKDPIICEQLYDLTKCRHPNVVGFYGIINTPPIYYSS
eukprot:Nk52_evm22s2474 gene=Nk52_evmTU22s2474